MQTVLANTPVSDRSHAIDQFLARNGWGDAVRKPLAGDASFRRYERIRGSARAAVLMDAPPAKEDVHPFIKVAQYLVSRGYSAPEILAQDQSEGFLLLEDLGDDLFTRVLLSHPHDELMLYEAAADVLVDIYRNARPPSVPLPVYDNDRLLAETGLFSEWFLPQIMDDRAADAGEEFLQIWKTLLSQSPLTHDTLVLRDFHADNLMWLPERAGIKKAGLLDFQDAVLGSPAYDLVSFLEDARRDVSPETVAAILDRFQKQTGMERERLLTEYAVLGAQRNCKIVGIFARLAVRDGKHGYLKFLPRVWGHLAHDVQHPLLKPLKTWLDIHIPAASRGEIALHPAHV